MILNSIRNISFLVPTKEDSSLVKTSSNFFYA